MSDLPLDYRAQLDLRAELARIDRDRAESQKLIAEGEKLQAEQRKLIAEDLKLAAEQRKLFSEGRKLNRDRWLAPLVLLASLCGGVIVAVISHVWR
jgi:hypothetical protein